MVYEISDNFGAFVAVDNCYSALIAKKEMTTQLKVGDVVSARVASIKKEGKLDLSLREKAYIQMSVDADKIINLLKGMICHVNLIPINKIEDGKFTKSTNENIIKFRDYLNNKGIVATIRRELGSDIDAACGQLRKKEVNK